MENKVQLNQAVDLALHDQWDASHQIVQNLEDEVAAWIHAVLHKIEGDIGNSQYWYRRAHRSYTDQDAKSELMAIRESLL